MAAFYKQSWFAPVASAATNFLFPSLGEAVGGGVNSLLGGALSSGTANALGSAIVGGGIGGLSSGTQGALTGALAGGATSALMGATGLNGGLSGLLGNGSFSGQAAANAGTTAGGVRDSSIADATGTTGGNSASAAKSGGALSNILGGGISPGLIAGMALMGGLGSAMSGSNKSQSQAAPTTTTDPNMTRGLSQVAFNRNRVPYDGDPKRYGMGPQHNYFDNNAIPVADGGYISDDQYPMRSERAQYEQAQAKLRQADQARRQLGYETPAMRAVRQFRSQKAIEAGELTGYADGGMVGPPQGAMQMPPQAMMGQGPGQSPMGMPPPRPQGSPLGGMMGGFPGRGMGMGRGRPMGGQMPMGRPGALAQSSAPPMPTTGAFARGGVAGPGTGRSDSIPAELSDGEYVIDSTTVALLGDGSSKAGAAKLDQMREEIRKRAGVHLAKGKMGPDAKPALAYIPGVR